MNAFIHSFRPLIVDLVDTVTSRKNRVLQSILALTWINAWVNASPVVQIK